jgi:hypothetical protein
MGRVSFIGRSQPDFLLEMFDLLCGFSPGQAFVERTRLARLLRQRLKIPGLLRGHRLDDAMVRSDVVVVEIAPGVVAKAALRIVHARQRAVVLGRSDC